MVFALAFVGILNALFVVLDIAMYAVYGDWYNLAVVPFGVIAAGVCFYRAART